MHNSKLTHYLSAFSKIELNQFMEFVHSPYFNKNEKLNHFCSLLCSHYPSFRNKLIEKEQMHAALFGELSYKEQRINDLMSYLTKLAEDFLSLKGMNKSAAKKQFLLVELRERNLDKYFHKTLRNTKQVNEKAPSNNYEYFYNNFMLEYEEDLFFRKKETRERNESLQKKVDNLDIFYLSTKLNNLCEMINRSNIVQVEYRLNLLTELLTYLKGNIHKYLDFPAISIYYQVLLTLTESENEKHYHRLKVLLADNYKSFEHEEAKQMYEYVQNYCIKKLNSGNNDYLPELLALYQSLLENKMIFELDGSLSQWDYKNIVSIANRLKQFDWTENFIHQYKDHLAPECRENAYNFNLASFYYSKQDYKKALKLLQQVEYTDLYYHLSAKSLLLKAYYEQEETEAFYSLIDSFKIFLKRNKTISDYQVKVHNNLLKFSKKAFDLRIKFEGRKNQKSMTEVKALKGLIEEAKEITNIKWLIEKVEELE